eukprot:1143817-Pelagomonas_calceolata.AAC.4
MQPFYAQRGAKACKAGVDAFNTNPAPLRQTSTHRKKTGSLQFHSHLQCRQALRLEYSTRNHNSTVDEQAHGSKIQHDRMIAPQSWSLRKAWRPVSCSKKKGVPLIA